MSATAGRLFLHGFGARYDLPIPLTIYLYAGAAVVVVSFVLVVLFASSQRGDAATGMPRAPGPWLAWLARSRVVNVICGAFGVLCLLTTIATGWFGSTNALQNPSAYLVWIDLWVGLVILSALIGNLWSPINPFDAIYRLGARVLPLPERLVTLPRQLGIWPATVTFFAIAWLELASGAASTPSVVATLAFVYTVLTLACMVVFGRRDWLERGEAFSVLFGIVSRFAPAEVERDASGRVTAA